MAFRSQDDNPHSFVVKTDARDFQLEQDVSGYKEYAEQSRQADADVTSNRSYRSSFVMPDIVAVEILTKYGLNIHAPEFMEDPNNYRRLKRIVLADYPHLMTSNMKKV
jgi:hypothetical protein